VVRGFLRRCAHNHRSACTMYSPAGAGAQPIGRQLTADAAAALLCLSLLEGTASK
jgi:hypothetical protein